MLELDDIADVIADAVREATAPLLARLDAMEKRELVPPEKGEPGRDVDMDEVATLIERAVGTAVGALPKPKDGEPGKDGVGLADAMKDAEGNLVLIMTDGHTKSLGKVDGEPGRDGVDGITPTFLDAEFVGRSLQLTFDGGKTCGFRMATPEYCGVFKEGHPYEVGDMVTWAGSLWHCNKDTISKPDSEDWTLAVKRGRDGKSAR